MDAAGAQDELTVGDDDPAGGRLVVEDDGRLSQQRQSSRSMTLDALVVGGLVVLAFALRAPQLGAKSLWHDDAWVAIVARVGYADVPIVALTSPGFSYLVKLWFDLVGFSDLAAQIPAFAFGVLGPSLLYVVLRARSRRSVAAIAGLALVLAPEHIVYSGRLKQYTVEVVLSLLVVWCAIVLLERPTSRRAWAALSGAGALGALVSFILAPVALLASFVGLLATRRAGRRALLAGTVATSMLGAVVALDYLLHIRHVRTDGLTEYWSENYVDLGGLASALTSLVELLANFLRGVTHLPPLLAAVVITPPMTMLALKRPLVALASFGPLLAQIAMSAAELAPLGGGRTDLHLIGPLIVGVALGADELLDLAVPARRSFVRIVVAGACASAIVVAGVARYEAPEYPQMETRELIELIESERRPGDAVLVFYPGRFAYGVYSDAEIVVSRRRSAAQYHLVFPEDHVFLGYDAAAAAEFGTRVWMIAASLQRDNYPDFRASLEAEHGLTPVGSWTRPGAELVLYETR